MYTLNEHFANIFLLADEGNTLHRKWLSTFKHDWWQPEGENECIHELVTRLVQIFTEV